MAAPDWVFRSRELTPAELSAVSVIPYKTELRYAWSAGAALSRFLEELRAGRIIGRSCNRCKRVLVPPRMFCEQCFRATDAWEYVRDTGRVNTYSISYVAADASRLREPIIPAVIAIDGASAGMGFLHLLGEVAPEEVRVGMPVEAVWKTPEQRVGAITDIRYFRRRRNP